MICSRSSVDHVEESVSKISQASCKPIGPCRPFLDRLRKKLEKGEQLTGVCVLYRLKEIQSRRIKELTGSGSRGLAVTIDLDAFSEIVCKTGRFESLKQAVEIAIGHPVVNRKSKRERQSDEWDSVWRRAETLIESDPAFEQEGPIYKKSLLMCVRELRRGWLVKATQRNASVAIKLIENAIELLKSLPCETGEPVEPIPLPIFAAEKTGDAHSLDNNQTLGKLILRFVAAGLPAENPDLAKAVWRRRVWESVGIITDELSSSVLVLNLPAVGDSLTDRLLQEHASLGMPCRITFRHFRLHPPRFLEKPVKTPLFVCENPSVIAAAADQLGERCPPMVCVEGIPNLTCWSVLRRLYDCQHELNYHGDFDWGGVRIANLLFEAFKFQPWRFTSADHKIVLDSHRKLKPPEAEALWDPQLANTIRNSGVAVEEESVIKFLLADLEGESQL